MYFIILVEITIFWLQVIFKKKFIIDWSFEIMHISQFGKILNRFFDTLCKILFCSMIVIQAFLKLVQLNFPP